MAELRTLEVPMSTMVDGGRALAGMRRPPVVNHLGRHLVIKGEVRSVDDLTIAGRIEGTVWCEDGAVTLEPSADVVGDVIARDITVFGRIAGHLLATDIVDIRPEAIVTGNVCANRLIVNEGAAFNGRAEKDVEVALRAARFKAQRRPAVGA